jgi:hypothetical protein
VLLYDLDGAAGTRRVDLLGHLPSMPAPAPSPGGVGLGSGQKQKTDVEPRSER